MTLETSALYIPALLPALVLAGVGLLVMLLEAFLPPRTFGLPSRVVMAGLAILGFVTAAAIAGGGGQYEDPAHMVRLDEFSSTLTVVFCIGGVLTVLLSGRSLARTETGAGELYCLLLFAATGAYLMAAANHLIVVFLGLEVLSVAVYPLAGFLRRDQRSNEASLKYFLLGAFSSAFFLYGIALIYGAVGMSPDRRANVPMELVQFDTIARYVQGSDTLSPLFWVGIALIVVSFCFKAALAPFHMWTPDVYDGSPAPVTAFMSSVVKAAAFAPFFRFLLATMGRHLETPGTVSAYHSWVGVIAVIAVLTMTWGNVAAVAEPSLKRMLAYSSVAHAGYIAVALVAESQSALVYYLLVYTLMVVGSFGCLALVRRRSGEEALQIKEWTGLGLRHPWLGAAMALFLFALAGFPPTAGFMGKFLIFRAALETSNNGYIGLVAAALINSLISVFYYVRVVVALYRTDPGETTPAVIVDRDVAASIAVGLCAVGVILLGVFPQLILRMLAGIP